MNGITVVRQAEFSDFEALQDAAQDGPSEIVQLEPGKMSGALLHLSVGTIGISTGNFSRGIRGRGVLSARRWMFNFFASPLRVQDFETEPGDLVLFAPGLEHYSSYSSANSYTSIFIDPDELFGFIGSQPGAQDAAAWRQPASLLKGTNSVTTAVLLALLAAIRDATTLSAGVADFYKRNILEQLTEPALKGVPYRGPRLLQSATKLVREVDRYLIEAGSRPIHTSELCEVFNVSRRTLHRAFVEVHGVPPITFMRRKRLGDARAALKAAQGPVMIRDIAIEHGFAELGRFAAAYRQMWGELPSQTLRRAQRRSK